MAPWGWIAGYLVLFALLHLLLYYVYARRSGDENGRSVAVAGGGDGAGPPYASTDRYADAGDDGDRSESAVRHAGVDAAEETIQCPHCGTINAADRNYTYCRRCVSTLRR